MFLRFERIYFIVQPTLFDARLICQQLSLNVENSSWKW